MTLEIYQKIQKISLTSHIQQEFNLLTIKRSLQFLVGRLILLRLLIVATCIASVLMDVDSLGNSRMSLIRSEEVHMRTLLSQKYQIMNNNTLL